ncbi:TVP38/TMEM64 family protein [Alkalicoccus luteus]|uniref:TVP38/TMEM64 family membrane protein n=1 Tax=Alkalicoccus luteus TaxID=1237094 RepID=A0A969PSN9_9BACI|nr:TVP38/TMEM64 family protein [Alkalicoccus luteus]NJP37218.1 TVP38/TMEM64 family protein [Alkalicoccus luteus]
MRHKWIMIAFTALFVILLWIYRHDLLIWIEQADASSILPVTVVAVFMSLFPVIPYPIVGGVIGAAYGPAGALIVWFGSTAASIIFFMMIRYGGFQAGGRKLIAKSRYGDKITLLFEKNAFMVLTVLRMIPVIPSIILNAYGGVSRISFFIYSIASAIGKLPAMILFAMIGHSIVTNPIELLYMALIYSIFLAFVYVIYRRWIRPVEKMPQGGVHQIPDSPADRV